MSYITARIDRKNDRIEVIERVNGKRVFNNYPVDYSFYIDDPNGSYKSIYNTPLTKITPKTSSEFYKELAILKGTDKKIWESDLNLTFKCLSENYKGKPAPDLHVALIDIEVDFDKDKGYSPIEDPFNKITAITIDLVWCNKLITVAIPPKTITFDEGQSIANKFENTYVFDNEVDMLNAALDILEDSDVISGWNSEGFDIPYLVNRIQRVMSKDDTRRLCELSWNEKPKAKVVEKYGKEFKTYELVGKIHIDMMDLYRKFTYEERHSYSLNSIAEYELGSSKTEYKGSLDDLYNNDFELFIRYNRQDVNLLEQLDNKLKFIELINVVAHDTTTLLPTCMGTVAKTDQAIINRAHDLGMIVPNKPKYSSQKDDDEPAAVGAYVADPKVGIHEWLGVIDINSLYPSTIRALNMGIETIIGQLRPTLTEAFVAEKMSQKGMTYSHAWEGVFSTLEYQAVIDRKPGVDIIIDWESTGTSDTLSASQIYDIIFYSDQKWMLSGNGTIFSYDQEAIIPGLLAKWYAERKELQAKKEEFVDLSFGITIPDNLIDALSS
jgi:DNA polymerase elongation subunit (family B)